MRPMNYTYNYTNKEYELIMNSYILSEKEKKFFEQLVKGYTCSKIAKILEVSERTVQNERKIIYNKLKQSQIPSLKEKELPIITLQIYMLIFPNGKVYIGKAINPKKRWRNGEGYKDNKEMYDDILKYKWENIEKKILYSGLSIDQAREKENETIVIYKSFMPQYGYNKQIISP